MKCESAAHRKTQRAPKGPPNEDPSKSGLRVSMDGKEDPKDKVFEQEIRADFREGDEDSNFSIFRVRQFTEWPGPLHSIAFSVEILTKPLIH